MGVRVLKTAVLLLVLAVGSPMQAHAQPAEGDIMISEIMYAPAVTDSDGEYIEVHNRTNRTIDLEDWVIVDEDPAQSSPRQDDINTSVKVGPGEFAVLCENDNSGANDGVTCAYDYANRISHTNTADYVVLQAPDGTEIDRVHYDEDNGWPEANDASIEYVGGETDDNAQAEYWQKATEREGDFATTAGQSKGSPNVNAPGGKLPVELTRLEVSTMGEQALLEWGTASETNNAGFVVQHRSAQADEWARLGFVDGAGTTNQQNTYDFRTEALSVGTHVFRLKQVDLDGTVHHSPKKRVRVHSDADFVLKGPNPLRAGEGLTVIVGTNTDEPVEIALYNVRGQRVRTVTRKAGRGRVQIPTRGLASGSYFLRARRSSSEAVRRVTIVR